jgi:hypothetical protein
MQRTGGAAMTDPITPPDELVKKLRKEAPWGIRDAGVTREICLIVDAYRAGADQELEACYEWLYFYGANGASSAGDARNLRAARRPNPPSLKDHALEAAQRFYAKGHEGCTDEEVKDDFDAICRALEALDD